MIGQSLLHYTVTEQLGVGGMGVVYCAQDTKLRRDVALKLLPAEVIHDSTRLERFEREARVLAALNHPHVGGIYGLEKDGKHTFLVLELVAGENLGDVLARGPLPLDRVLTLGRQIAEGLEAAHEQGIIHRDLKPQNIMLTPEGTVKILDFGLAKALDPESRDPALSMGPTVTSGHTLPGAIMGTAAYMSPEQARGTLLDRRTDIWAFGCVLFEMLCGQRVFQGETMSDVLASVLKTDPQWDALPADTPPALRRLLARCFQRDPRQRLRDIGEARIRLEAMIGGDLGEEEAAVAGSGRSLGRTVLMTLAVGLVLGAAGWWLGHTLQEKPEPGQLRQFVVAMNEPELPDRVDPIVSPDGKRVAWAQGGELWVQELDQLGPRRIPDLEDIEAPFWSPDGQEIGFFAGHQLWRVPITGGQKKVICDLGAEPSGGRGAFWTEDGLILFSRGSTGILSAPAIGGDPTEVIAVQDSLEGDLHEPYLLPDGSIMFVVHPKGLRPGRLVVEKDDQRTVLVDYPQQSIWNPRYADGYIIFERATPNATGIWALPYDVNARAALGDPVLLVPDGSRASMAQDGLLVYGMGRQAIGNEQLVWVDRAGKIIEPATDIFENTGAPVLSPDGTQIAMAINENTEIDVWIQDRRRGTRTRMSHPGAIDIPSCWAPDGQSFFFFNMTAGSQVFRRSLDTTAPVDTLFAGTGGTIARDGRTFLNEIYKQDKGQITVTDLETGEARPLFAGPDSYINPQLSPDNRWVSYTSDESGRNEIYIRTFPEGSAPQRVSLDGGDFARWSRDGSFLNFTTETGFYEVTISTEGGRLEMSRPVRLFGPGEGNYLFDRGFDISLDGEKFLLPASTNKGQDASQGNPEIVAMLNWRRILADQ